MNPLYKLYARTYQGIFRMLIPVLPYRNPKIIENLANIADVILENNKRKPLIVTDEGIMKFGLINPLTKAFEEKGIEYEIFSKVQPNPTTTNVKEAKAFFLHKECDSIIAFGGGSAMDCAKAMGALIAKPKKNLNKLAGVLKVRKKIPLLIAVPTTCGTGSETTLAAVITDPQTRHKYAINDFNLIPSYAVLDHTIIKTLPSHLVATTGLDALTHAVEAYIGRSTTKATRADALEAIKLIFANLEAATRHEEEALGKMLYASHLAGRAFSVSYVGYVHALAHQLGGTYNIPHGYANAVILPHVLKQYGKAIHKKLAQISDYCKLTDENEHITLKAKAFMDKLMKLENALDIDTNIPQIRTGDIEDMAALAMHEANPLYPVPVMWDKKTISKMYFKIKGLEIE